MSKTKRGKKKPLLRGEILSTAHNLMEEFGDGEAPLSDMVQFMERLRSYRIDAISFGDLYPDDVDEGAQSSEIARFHINFDRNEQLAARVFFDFQVLVTSHPQTYQMYPQLILDFKNYCWRQIRMIEGEIQDNPTDTPVINYVKGHVIVFLWHIIRMSLETRDHINLLKAYHELADYIEFHQTTREWERYLMPARESLGLSFRDFLNDSQLLRDSKKALFGNHPLLMKRFTEAISYALDDEPCLILGETGTGKDIIAKIIHGFSLRKDNNYWPVNVGGFSAGLFDAELQGVTAGAATDVGTRLGAFLKACGTVIDGVEYGYHVAHGAIQFRRIDSRPKSGSVTDTDVSDEDLAAIGGTLFLDEINSIDAGLQSKLLRIIEQNEVQVVGEDRTRKFHVKLLCASNTNFSEQIQTDGFRDDLYHRISKGVIELPPLRELKDSFPEIIKLKVDELAAKINFPSAIDVRASAVHKLEKYGWPGNHRELENVLYRSLKSMFLKDESELKDTHIEELADEPKVKSELSFRGMTYHNVEKKYMEFLALDTRGNKSLAARKADLGRTPIYRLWKEYKLDELCQRAFEE